MATTLLRLFSKHTLNKTCQCISVYKLPIEVNAVRYLYAKQTLGMEGFIMQQEKSRNQMVNIADKFREKMTEYSGNDSKNMIFTEDLKNMIHLSETDQDIDIVIKMIKKFNAQNNQVRFGNFVFGPVVMRLLYKYNKVAEALELFKAQELSGFFDQIITYQILLDLLYENGQYDEMLGIFEDIKSRQLNGTKYPRNVIVLITAACYKQNTPQSLEYILNLWKELNTIGHLPMRRATTFAAGLALSQNKPEIALEILVSTKNQNYTTVRNIKAIAYADLGRVEDALVILKNVLQEDTPANTIQTFNKNVLDKVKEAVLKLGDAETTAEFNRIESLLLKQGHVVEQTLEDQLTSEIQSPPIMNNREGQRQYQERYQNTGYRRNPQQQQQQGNRNRSYTYSQRPGLNELQ